MSKSVIVVMTRWHAERRCKQRLSSIIGSRHAALTQEKLTNHTFKVVKELEDKNLIRTHLAITGLGPKAIKRWGKQTGITIASSQGNGSLGLRMRRQILKASCVNGNRTQRPKSIVIIGTDLPNLCTLNLLIALDLLTKNELVIGPAEDGGYWLLGLSGTMLNPIASWPFCGIPWGTNQVLEKTIQEAKKNGIKPQFLSYQNDLDQYKDLAPWLNIQKRSL